MTRDTTNRTTQIYCHCLNRRRKNTLACDRPTSACVCVCVRHFVWGLCIMVAVAIFPARRKLGAHLLHSRTVRTPARPCSFSMQSTLFWGMRETKSQLQMPTANLSCRANRPVRNHRIKQHQTCGEAGRGGNARNRNGQCDMIFNSTHIICQSCVQECNW